MIDEEKLYTQPQEVFGDIKCGGDPNPESWWQRIKRLGIRWSFGKWYWRTRKRFGSFIIGNPKYNKGILLQIPLGRMTDEQRKAFFESRRWSAQAGIGCDSGMGCGNDSPLDLEWDWSLRGAYAICRRCGSDTRDQVKEYIKEKKQRHHEYLIGKNSNHSQAEVCKSGECHCFNDQREELGY